MKMETWMLFFPSDHEDKENDFDGGQEKEKENKLLAATVKLFRVRKMKTSTLPLDESLYNDC
jgi:hypothetical protein